MENVTTADIPGRRMTWDEIRRAFPDEYVVVEEPETEPIAPRVSGRVIGHGKDRNDLLDRTRSDTPRDLAIVFTGVVRGGFWFVEEGDPA